MTKVFTKPLFWTNVAAFTITGLVVAGLAFGWNNPTAAPNGGNGAISADASHNVTIGGNVSWSGYTLTGGGVPWARLTGIPGACGPGQFIKDMSLGGCGAPSAPDWSVITGKPAGCLGGWYVDNAGTGHCTQLPAGGGGVTGSGTANNLAMWTSSSAIGNASGAITFPGDINAPSLTTGATANTPGPQAFNSSGYWGGAASGTTGAPWSASCPAGKIMVGIGQTSNGSLVTPYIVCAPL